MCYTNLLTYLGGMEREIQGKLANGGDWWLLNYKEMEITKRYSRL